MKETTPVLLEIDGVRTYIRQRQAVVRAVDGVSFSVDAGETVGIVGESGCGKTMTGMSVISLLPPGGYIAGGSILFEGRDLTKISDREIRDVRGNQVAMIFQDPMTSLESDDDDRAPDRRARHAPPRSLARGRARPGPRRCSPSSGCLSRKSASETTPTSFPEACDNG